MRGTCYCCARKQLLIVYGACLAWAMLLQQGVHNAVLGAINTDNRRCTDRIAKNCEVLSTIVMVFPTCRMTPRDRSTRSLWASNGQKCTTNTRRATVAMRTEHTEQRETSSSLFCHSLSQYKLAVQQMWSKLKVERCDEQQRQG